ncbi:MULTISPECIES: NB-ARC domain-containing protein [Okeania]|uniref:NB-ARC domain-containing protein n=3 Tax=Microcoleaceae TaxID=1892252 RepID=UPI000F5203C9|nr:MULTISPECIES: NB-ARC domain-containing protein [Okeania]NET76720.1 ATPase [Okeania sp. SIO1F9]RQH19415.1 ATPase [Okeania hirsuta]
MTLNEVLRFMDDIVFDKTGKHLDSLQKAILRATWQGEKYSKVAQEYHCTKFHVGNVASNLWQLISQELKEKIHKSNFRAAMERYQISNFSNVFIGGNNCLKGNINLCTDNTHSPETKQKLPTTQTENKNNTPLPKLDLRDAPDIRKIFYDRSTELTTLKTWIVKHRCRLITVSGISGIGKSTIIRHLIPEIESNFDHIIWRTLRTSPPLNITLKNLIETISNVTEKDLPNNTNSQLSILIEKLRDIRCLIILDDVQKILNSQQLVGNYKQGYENYGNLFKIIGELPHNSCFLLNSWEPPLEIFNFTDNDSAVRLFQLNGLTEKVAREMLKNIGLLDEEKWQELINFYQGNPQWLKLVGETIKNLFGGSVAQYLSYKPLFLCDELTNILKQHFQRLSELEKQLLYQLSELEKSVSVSQLLEKSQLSSPELFQTLLSLEKRDLIDKITEENQILFMVKPIFKQYSNYK